MYMIPRSCLLIEDQYSSVCETLEFADQRDKGVVTTMASLAISANTGCTFVQGGTGSWIEINYSPPLEVYISPYYMNQFADNELMESGKRYQVGRYSDIFLGSHKADTFNIGIVNPSDEEQLITAILYQTAITLTQASLLSAAVLTGLLVV